MSEEDIDAICRSLNRVASSIKPLDASAGSDAYGGSIDSLTESVMGVTSGLHDIASALREVADAIRGNHANT